MGEVINALRLYVEKGEYSDNYTKKELKLLEKSGVFYGVLTYTPTRIKRLSAYTGSRFRIVLDKTIVSKLSIEEKTPHTAVVRVGDDSAVLELKDLFWLAELELYPADELKLIRWISNNLKLNLPEKSKLYRNYDSVVIETNTGTFYTISLDGEVRVDTRLKIDGVSFRVATPVGKEEMAISLAKELLSNIYGNLKIVDHKENTIYLRDDKLYVRAVFKDKYKLIGKIEYYLKSGKVDIGLASLTSRYQFNVIHRVIAKRYGIPKDALPSTIVEASKIPIDKAREIVRIAVTLLKHSEPINEKEPEKIVARIEEILRERKVPIPLENLPPDTVARMYFYAVSKNSKRLTTFMHNVFREEVRELLKNMYPGTLQLLKEYVKRLGGSALKEFKELTKEKEEEVEYVEAG